jgi:hypothetical protein
MIAVEENPVVSKPRATTPPLPREHGAWGILLIPFATAVGVSGVCDLKIAFLLGSVLCFYVARASYLKGNARWTATLLVGSVACTVPLLVVWRLWWLIAFGAVAAPLAFRKPARSTAMQLLAVCGLTLTAPAAWCAATLQIDGRAWLLWLLNVLCFAGGVFYVKMHVAAAIRRKRFESFAEKARHGAAVLAYYAGLLVVLLALASSGVVSLWITLAYAPVVLRALIGVGRLGPTLRIKRLGWTEVAYSLVYAVVLVATLRFG